VVRKEENGVLVKKFQFVQKLDIPRFLESYKHDH